MKTKLLILSLFCILINSSFAQYGELTKSQLELLKKNKTYFVLDDDTTSLYNHEIKKLVPIYWKLNSYSFISLSQFSSSESLRSESQNGFVIKSHYGARSAAFMEKSRATGNMELQNTYSPSVDALVLVMGGNIKYGIYPKTSIIFVSVSTFDIGIMLEDALTVESYKHKLGNCLQAMQNFTSVLEKSGENKLGSREVKKLYNENRDSLKKKTILINIADMKEQMELKGDSTINNFKFVKADVIEKAIDAQDKNFLILHCMLTSYVYQYFVAEANGGKIVYANWFTPNHVSHNINHMLEDLSKNSGF